jgi:hypothetical protein
MRVKKIDQYVVQNSFGIFLNQENEPKEEK